MFLNAHTPDELRAAVEASLDPVERTTADLEARATGEAARFAKLTSSGFRSLLEERSSFFAECVRSAATYDGLRAPWPEAGRAVLVHAADFATSEVGEDTPYGWRAWKYLSAIWLNDTKPGSEAHCDRCAPPRPLQKAGEWHRKRIAGVFHIARGPFVVEFALCDRCWADASATISPTHVG